MIFDLFAFLRLWLDLITRIQKLQSYIRLLPLPENHVFWNWKLKSSAEIVSSRTTNQFIIAADKFVFWRMKFSVLTGLKWLKISLLFNTDSQWIKIANIMYCLNHDTIHFLIWKMQRFWGPAGPTSFLHWYL